MNNRAFIQSVTLILVVAICKIVILGIDINVHYSYTYSGTNSYAPSYTYTPANQIWSQRQDNPEVVLPVSKHDRTVLGDSPNGSEAESSETEATSVPLPPESKKIPSLSGEPPAR